MYVYTYVCVYVCMYVRMLARACMYESMWLGMCVCLRVCSSFIERQGLQCSSNLLRPSLLRIYYHAYVFPPRRLLYLFLTADAFALTIFFLSIY